MIITIENTSDTALGLLLKRMTAIGVAILTAITVFLTPAAPAFADPGGWNRVSDGGWQRGQGHKRHWKKHQREQRHSNRAHNQAHNSSTGSLNGGHLIGGILGAVLGTQVGKGKGRAVAIIGGGLLGALIGGAVGQSMDDADHYRTQAVLETTPTGRSVEWTNPDSGATYTVTPTQTYDNGGTPCREYTTWVFIDGYEEEATGTACRDANGTWKTANSSQTEQVAYYPVEGGR